MRIGFDAKRLFCNFTGLGNYSRTLLKNLAEFYPGNDYILYTPEFRQSAETEPFRNNPAFKTFAPETSFKSVWRSYSIVNQLKKDKIQLFHGLSHELPVGVKSSGIKTVVTIHDLIFKRYPETYPFFDRQIYDLKFRHACRVADKIVAISENTRQDLIEYYKISPGKIEVIYQACNPLFYQLQSQEVNDEVCRKYNIPPEYMLYVGSIEERKNLKVLIRAFNNLRSSLKIPLVLVGRGKKYKAEVEQLIAELGLGKWIIRVDRLEDNKHLQSVYQNAMLLIYPSVYEGFGLPVAEALLSKTPVITANTSSLPEAGGPSTVYFDPGNSEELTAVIENVLSNTALRLKMIAEGYTYAHTHFSPEILSNKMITCYRNT